MPNIAFTDVETTGLDPHDDALLEIAVVITDERLNILDEGGFHAVIRYDAAESEMLRRTSDPFVQEMHSKTGLWDALPYGSAIHQVDRDLTAYLRGFGEPRTLTVGGNSVRLDMNFLDRYLPTAAGFLDYHMRDVSSLAGFATDWLGIDWFEKESDHTAQKDVRESIREARHYAAILAPQAFA